MGEDTLDTLAAIAARGAVGEQCELSTPRPPDLPNRVLPAMQPGADAAFNPRPRPSAQSLKAELTALRERMAPFLEDCAPPWAATRSTIELREARWRLDADADWQSVRLPHYGGPIGRARAWYRMEFECAGDCGPAFACFGGVDYQAAVFLNGELVGTHEGFFAPFECALEGALREGTNELLVRVDNDAIFMGNQSWDDSSCGDKLYAATGLGWDEPGLGWHHCPPGMGIHRPVRIEFRPPVHLHDLFVRPLDTDGNVEIWVEVMRTGPRPEPLALDLTIHGANFPSPAFEVAVPENLPPADPGVSRYRVRTKIPAPRLWEPSTPWMYELRAELRSGGRTDRLRTEFGLRTFVLDESPGDDGLRGRFFLNGRPVRLRGANTMGHEQQCVLHGDLDQLRDDILLAKLANMNFLRFTQRPVEPEVYRMCDRLGLMAQTDLPLFAYLRRNKFAEAVRQAVEMERLTRRHPSCVLSSFINEPFPAAWGDKSHRHLTRRELEGFFTAATEAMRVENPDRQIKPIDGDYEPPGPGLPDNHCYCGWYNGHGLDLGLLHKGFWVQIKPGWNYACGEFGSEGLDFEEVMRGRYPAAWLPDPDKGPADEAAWTPARIYKAQTGSHFHFWFERGRSMAEWIARSQAHQAWITRLMTEALRRDNRMVSFAIHLFIDAWPAGWMKTIMDCRRVPKPAYFAYRDALAPLAVSLRMDRTAYFSGERASAEAWICNDLDTTQPPLELAWQFAVDGAVVSSARTPARILSNGAAFQGRIEWEIPAVDVRSQATLTLGLIDADGRVLHDANIELDVFPACPPIPDHAVGSPAEIAAELPAGWMVCDDPALLGEATAFASDGGSVLITGLEPGTYRIAGSEIRVERCGMNPRHFVARSPSHPVCSPFRENDFRFWYDPATDCPAPLLKNLFFADETWSPILRTGQLDWGRPAEEALAAAEKAAGKGRIVVCLLELKGRLVNPAGRLFLRSLASPAS